MDALTRHRQHRASVWFRDGYFLFTVVDADRNIIAAGGADKELPRLGDLIQASRLHVDWAADSELRNRLARMERGRYDQETQEILERIVA